jgi:ATP-dependent helicase Lhr and Lhr-like helicase
METTSSPPSDSELPADAFQQLHSEVQRWIWDRGWTSLRDIQALAIQTILKSNSDALIAASTASGKTEAAFLPILSSLASAPEKGIQAVYIGPLKALINDQFQRLEDLCDRLEISVTKWHGDAPAAQKQRLKKEPSGVLLITPESLEALFLRQPELLVPMFGKLKFIVIDELHAFLDSERGVQLASLLKRLDERTGNASRRIGLSATIGDLGLAAAWLRPDDPVSVSTIQSHISSSALQLQIRGIVQKKPKSLTEGDEIDDPSSPLGSIADHLFKTLRSKGNHLVFAGSRRTTEALSDKLRRMCEAQNVPNEFFPHHGNLSRETREVLEGRLRDGALPTTAVATTTLELGIDIGSVESIAQIGAPSSISSMRQRLGRSGRRENKPAVLRIYTVEQEIAEDAGIFSKLRAETVQAVAAVRLLLRKWVEPPNGKALHLSTLLHQILAMIVQQGGATPNQLFKVLGGSGPFEKVTPDIFVRLLQSMHDREHKLVEQASDRTVMLGALGEKLTGHYDFYSVFVTYDEATIVAGNKTLGTLSIVNALGPGDYIIFAGRRWVVKEMDDLAKRVLVEPAPAGRVPQFEGDAAPLGDMLAQEMYATYMDAEVPIYLDKTAREHLLQGRAEFKALGLDNKACVLADGRLYIFPWAGSYKLDMLRLALRYCGVCPEQGRIGLSVSVSEGHEQVFRVIRDLAQSTPPGEALALLNDKLRSAKYDYLLPDDLLREAFADERLDLDWLANVCKRLCVSIDAL